MVMQEWSLLVVVVFQKMRSDTTATSSNKTTDTLVLPAVFISLDELPEGLTELVGFKELAELPGFTGLTELAELVGVEELLIGILHASVNTSFSGAVKTLGYESQVVSLGRVNMSAVYGVLGYVKLNSIEKMMKR